MKVKNLNYKVLVETLCNISLLLSGASFEASVPKLTKLLNELLINLMRRKSYIPNRKQIIIVVEIVFFKKIESRDNRFIKKINC